MSILQFLQLQTVDPTDDGTVSPLDDYQHDETIDLDEELDEGVLEQEWEMVIDDLEKDPEKLTFHDE